jgi:hypothetical protein
MGVFFWDKRFPKFTWMCLGNKSLKQYSMCAPNQEISFKKYLSFCDLDLKYHKKTIFWLLAI